MHHAFSPSGAGESSSTSRHSFLRFLPCSRPFACLGLRACTTLLLLLALSVISPLFFTERIRQINLHLHPAQQQSSALAISGQMLSVDNLAHVPLFKKQPRDRLTKLTPKYTLEPSICSGEPSTHPFLVIFVPSRPGYAEERAAVRETWGNHARQCNVRVVFGFGSFESDDLFDEARTENSLYGDLLQTSRVIDAYHNQTLLVLSFLEWGAAHCQGAKFIGKADEDTWINIRGVLKYLRLPEAGENSVIGHFLYEEVVKRLPEEKWFLTLAEYPNATYPPFAVGQLYVFPQTSLSAVLEAARHIPVHWLDDVYIGGQIPAYLKMTLMHVHERAHLWEVDSLKCYGDKYYIIHATPAERKREIYYDRCMERYRKEACQAHSPAQIAPLVSETGRISGSLAANATVNQSGVASKPIKDSIGTGGIASSSLTIGRIWGENSRDNFQKHRVASFEKGSDSISREKDATA